MLIAVIAFLVVSALSFLLLTLFIYGGSNVDDDVATARGGRLLLFGRLTPALAGMIPVRPAVRERYTRWLRQAGHYHSQALHEFLALRNVLAVGTLLLTATFLVVSTQPGEPNMYWIAVGGAVLVTLLYALPPLFLESRATARKERIESSLPDALDMVTMCTSAGLPLEHSIARVSGEMWSTHPDLAYELRLVERQSGAGSLSSAMQQFANRVDAPEIHSVASMIRQAEQQGASVAGAFHAFADQTRLSRRQRAEEAGNRSAFKMLFPLVFCLAPAVYIMLLGPAVMNLRDFLVREKQPGGALSATPQGIEAMLSDTQGTPIVEGVYTGQTSPRGVPGASAPQPGASPAAPAAFTLPPTPVQ